MLSFFKIPRGFKKIDYFRSRFYWQEDEQEKTVSLCQPKYQGGLGIHDFGNPLVGLFG
jgi:hypothetical protein